METKQQMRDRHKKRRKIQAKRAERALRWKWRKDNALTEFCSKRLVERGLNDNP